MRTDVFVRVCALNPLREAMARVSLVRWLMEPDAAVRVILADGSTYDHLIDLLSQVEVATLPMDQFWRTSKQAAEDLARTDPYVFADDDQLVFHSREEVPGWTGWVSEGLKACARHPEFGILAGWSTFFAPAEVKPGWEDVLPVRGAVGAPCFVRRGAVGTFPEAPIGEHDFATCGVLREKRIPFGLIRNCRYLHLGHRSSQVSPDAPR